MLGRRLRNTLFASFVAASAIFAGSTACSAKKNTEIIVAVQTDLRVPKDLNAVTIRVLSKGAEQFSQTSVVGPTGLHLPATIGLVPQDESSLDPIEVQIIGQFNPKLDGDARTWDSKVLRKTRLTFAKDRVGLVRMPLKFSCYGMVDDKGCKDEETCVAGKCQPIPVIEGVALPPYTPEQVFGAGGVEGKQGACFDGDTCLAKSQTIARTADACVYSIVDALPTGGEDAGTGPDAATMTDAGSGGSDASDPGFDASAMPDTGSTSKDAGGGSTDAGVPPPMDGGVPFKFKSFTAGKEITVVLATPGTGGQGFCAGGECRVALDYDELEGWTWSDDTKTKIRLAPGICDKVKSGAVRVEATDACGTKTPETSLCDTSGAPVEDGGGSSDSSVCMPKDCLALGWQCGAGDDGCGGKLDCGVCPDPSVCGADHRCTAMGVDSGSPDVAPKGSLMLKFDGAPSVPVGASMQAHAIWSDATGAMTEVTSKATWSSSNPSVATISNMSPNWGFITANSTGFTSITVSYMGQGAGSDFSVTPAGTDAGTCVPMTCATIGFSCGPAGDGCGGVLMCGTCSTGFGCSGGKCVPTGGDASTADSATCKPLGMVCGLPFECCSGACSGTCVPGGASDASVDTGGTATDAGDAGVDNCPAAPTTADPLIAGWTLQEPNYGAPFGSTSYTLLYSGVTPGSPLSTAGTCNDPTSASFDGSTSYLQGNIGPLGINFTSLTYSLYAYLDPASPPPAGAVTLSTLNPGAKRGFAAGADSTTSAPVCSVYLTDGTLLTATGGSTIPAAGWYHVTCTAQSGKPLQMFVNGSLIASSTGTVSTTIAGSGELSIGRANFPTPGNYWKGALAEVRIYGK